MLDVPHYPLLVMPLQGLEVPKPTKEITGLIKASFAQCERDKPQIQPNADNDRLYCENFALNVFRRADKVDRAGRADMNTCKAFYAAAIFLQVRLLTSACCCWYCLLHGQASNFYSVGSAQL